MSSVQRLIANHTNLIPAATLTASEVAVANAVRTMDVTRTGNGRIRLTGDYAGHETSDIDILIASGGATLRASTPTFAGVGNGTLTVDAVGGGAQAETWSLTLVDLGTDTTHASLTVDTLTLRAVVAGAAGNAVRLTVTPALTRAATVYSLLADWPAGQATLPGPEFDFGGLPLSAKGELDATSPRLQIGQDHTVYRPYRLYKDGAWQYGLTPAPFRALPADSLLYSVTGGYDVVVTDGVDTETYPGLVTFYDLAQALAASALLTVDGVVVADRKPGGMDARDVPLRTGAWVLSATGVALDSLAPATTAPTESVTVECINDDAVGAEVWRVFGTVTGEIGTATTGTAFSTATIGFTVPDKAASVPGTGQTAWKYTPATRDVGEDLGDVCVRELTLGINARPKSVTFRYEARPDVGTCDCNSATLIGRFTDACLGLDGGTDMALDAAYQTRLEALFLWRSGFMERQVILGADTTASSKKRKLIDAVAATFADTVAETYSVSAANTEWDAALVAAKADFEALDSPSEGYSTPTAITSPSSAALKIGGYYSYAGVNWRIVKITKTSGGEVQQAVTASALVLTGLDINLDTDQAITDATYTYTFRRTEQVTNYVQDGTAVTTSAAFDVLVVELTAKYKSRMDYVRALAGLVPKSDASTASSGDGCWRDSADAYWWVDTNGDYYPAFNNTAYISSKTSTDSGASAGIPAGEPYSTKEFAFYIGVGCADRLKEGDTVTITINGVDGNRPYAVGDKAELAIVAAGPAYLAGGVDGDDTHTWSVLASASGSLADYEIPAPDTGTVPTYTAAGVTVQLAHGGIPYVLGDKFDFAIESGQFRWRQDGGLWSALTDIAPSVSLADGLSAEFIAGASPSFVAADYWWFRAEQPNAPSGLTTPDDAGWAWSSATATLTADLGGSETIHAVTLARLDLPAGASLTVEGSDDSGATWAFSETMDLTNPVAALLLDTPWTVTHLRLSLADAAAGRIGWWWAGKPIATAYSATTCRLARTYGITRGSGLNPASAYAGRGQGGELAWSDSLLQTDLDALLPLLDHLAENGEPMILVPHHLHPGESALVTVDADAIDLTDIHEYQPDDTSRRLISMTLPLRAELA